MSLLGAACGRPPATHASAGKACQTENGAILDTGIDVRFNAKTSVNEEVAVAR